MRIIYFWSRQYSNAEIEVKMRASSNTVVDWLKIVRGVCETHIFDNNAMIGGPGRTVAIGESKFFHRKYHRGRYRDGQWVFDAIDVDDASQCVLVPVERRDAATLEGIIQNRIRVGTRIWSDEWKAYTNIERLGYTLYTVNHSENFVCPHSGVHTNNIEGMWAKAKRKFRHMSGTSEDNFGGYLEEFVWLKRYKNMRFQRIFTHIVEQY